MGYGCYGTGVGLQRGIRSFLTKEERIRLLKEYKENLEKETQGVTERIKELEASWSFFDLFTNSFLLFLNHLLYVNGFWWLFLIIYDSLYWWPCFHISAAEVEVQEVQPKTRFALVIFILIIKISAINMKN